MTGEEFDMFTALLKTLEGIQSALFELEEIRSALREIAAEIRDVSTR